MSLLGFDVDGDVGVGAVVGAEEVFNLGGFVVGFVEGDGAVHQDVEFDGTVAHDAGNEFKEEQYDVYCSSYQSHLIDFLGAVHLLVVDSGLLDGEAALVVLDVLLEAGNVLGSRSDADASVACKDNLLEIISQRKFVGIIHGVTS